ncbi:hypothetical protein H6F98_10675 [Microcoleus sp. FACHB-SPT15]|uniref:hypothetical protein n=1 Tax=Microcoleus sp. FACHB-SPT15 TaxID=2692830 RepID=UPI00177DD545|nr:hypothetical protein [Microcoleus sp. FACHB-SPT15]MBD1805913.1 hypothetical protein [Microcoleus sp. FACHB-SPT15]
MRSPSSYCAIATYGTILALITKKSIRCAQDYLGNLCDRTLVNAILDVIKRHLQALPTRR